MTQPFPRIPIVLEPHLTERPWGGRRMQSELGKPIPEGKVIGETWEFSDHPHGRSTVRCGAFAGQLIGDVIRAHPIEMIGRPSLQDRHPLLVKFIDAEDDLSLQVHPPDSYAIPRGDRGKSECWYVMRAEPGAELIFGLVPGTTREQLADALRRKRPDHLVLRFPLQVGSFLMVHPGNVHAILKGTLICEIQQSSDTTYRLWDWDRQPARPLHLQESLDVINFREQIVPPWRIPPTGQLTRGLRLTTNEYFTVTALDVPPGATVALPGKPDPTGRIAVTVDGSCRLDGPDGGVEMPRGRTAFLPACCETQVRVTASAGGPCRLLLAESREL